MPIAAKTLEKPGSTGACISESARRKAGERLFMDGFGTAGKNRNPQIALKGQPFYTLYMYEIVLLSTNLGSPLYWPTQHPICLLRERWHRLP